MTVLWVGVTSFLMGAISLLCYLIWRMLRSDGWDSSNITNALRLLSHVALHPEDFAHMWYISARTGHTRRPFWYVNQDEITDVVQSRPNDGEKERWKER